VHRLPVVYIIQRLASTIPILLGVVFLVVAATDLIPGSPADRLSTKGGLSAEQIKKIEKQNGWDLALGVRYFRYVKNVVWHGNLGESIKRGTPVTSDLRSCIPATMELTITAMIIAMVLGVTMGVVAALRPFSIIDYGSMFIALCGISFPVFWLGIILQILIFPSSARVGALFDVEAVTGFYLIDTLFWGETGSFWSSVKHLILPASALATIPLAVIARMTRASMMEVLTKDYVRTAKAKGLASYVVVIKHALRNALIPVVTITGLQFASLLGGAVLTETVFQWPGLGNYIYEAAFYEDLPALQGSVLFVAVVFTLLNLLVDLSYGFIDPRIGVDT
jgi:peptide/nickel transport system permease protein